MLSQTLGTSNKKYKIGFSVIISDSDSAFLGGKDSTDERNFQKVLDDNDCIHDSVPTGDHNFDVSINSHPYIFSINLLPISSRLSREEEERLHPEPR